MLNINAIKSHGRQLLSRWESFAKAMDYDPRVDMLERIRELERELAALKTRQGKAPLV